MIHSIKRALIAVSLSCTTAACTYIGASDIPPPNRINVPGTQELTLEPGRYTVFYESRAQINGEKYTAPEVMPSIVIAVYTKTGKAIPLAKVTSPYEETLNTERGYSTKDGQGIGAWNFKLTEAGTYRFAASETASGSKNKYLLAVVPEGLLPCESSQGQPALIAPKDIPEGTTITREMLMPVATDLWTKVPRDAFTMVNLGTDTPPIGYIAKHRIRGGDPVLLRDLTPTLTAPATATPATAKPTTAAPATATPATAKPTTATPTTATPATGAPKAR